MKNDKNNLISNYFDIHQNKKMAHKAEGVHSTGITSAAALAFVGLLEAQSANAYTRPESCINIYEHYNFCFYI